MQYLIIMQIKLRRKYNYFKPVDEAFSSCKAHEQ